MKRVVFSVLIFFAIYCSYTQITVNNNYYSKDKEDDQEIELLSSSILKNRRYMVYGYLGEQLSNAGPYLVTAYTTEFGEQELVDTYQMGKAGFYSLSLPQGSFYLYVFRDINRDFIFTNEECIGKYEGNSETITFASVDSLQSSIRRYDIDISNETEKVGFNVNIKYEAKPQLTESSVFPMGSIRDIDDEIFIKKYGIMGYYNPEEFREQIELNFYSLQEYSPAKQPIIFIHGKKSTPAEFKKIVQAIDQMKFQPWFFYYPSGAAANETVDILYEIFFSNRFMKVPRKKMIMVVEGTGALILKGAINRSVAEEKSNTIEALITIGTPFSGEVIDSLENMTFQNDNYHLNDLSVGSRFIKNINSIGFKRKYDHHLFFSYGQSSADSTVLNNQKIGDLTSQLNYESQFNSTSIFGFNETAETILKSDTMITKLKEILNTY